MFDLFQCRQEGSLAHRSNNDSLLWMQGELVAGSFMKPAADAQAAVKGAAKGRKAAKRQGAGSGTGFRSYTSPGGLQVGSQEAVRS